MTKMTIGFVATFLFLLIPPAQADSVLRLYGAGRFDVEVGVDYFKTSANFQSDSTKATLPSGYYLQSINVVSQARYAMFDRFAILGGAAINTVETNDNLSKRTNSSLTHVFIGADYRLISRESWDLFVEGSYTQALEKIDVGGDSALNSDGANEIKGALGGILRWGHFHPFGKVGINYRTEGLSTLLTYTSGIEADFDGFAFGGLINGHMTVKDDDKGAQAFERDVLTGRVNAGSKRYYSVNPSLTDTEVYAVLKFDNNLSARVFGGYTLIGTNSAEGFHVGASVTWGFGGQNSWVPEFIYADPKKPSRQQPRKTKPITSDPAESGFKEDVNDGVNQDYFKPVKPTKDDYIEQIDGARQNQESAPVVKPKQKVKPALNPALEKEYKIKLKKKKKKKTS